MNTGTNYDAPHGHHEPTKPAQPKPFSLTQSMQHPENLNSPQRYIHGHSGHSDTASHFRPVRSRGGDQPLKRPPLFPALQRFQKPQDQNSVHHYQPPQKQPSRPPFFSLLKPPAAAPPQDSLRHFYPAQTTQAWDSVDHRMKLEQFSDKVLSPSPPPHPSSTDTHTSTHDELPQPLQLLPPPPPPIGPISRPGTPARPQSKSRSRSRSTSYRQDDVTVNIEGGFDGPSVASSISKSTDLPDIAIRALREVQSVNVELKQERSHTKSLLSQLNALTTAHEALKFQLSSTEQDFLSARRQSEEYAQEATATKKALASTTQELASAKLELSTASAKLKGEQQQAKTKIAQAKKSMMELGQCYESLRASFGELKMAFDASQTLVAELRDARACAADGLRTLQPLLNDEGQYARAASVKVLVKELQDEIADARRVIDLLRDKLHHLSSQLADAQCRVRELEAGERAVLSAALGRMTTLDGDENGSSAFGTAMSDNGGREGNGTKRETLVEKMEAILARLVERERETIGVLAEAAEMEAKLGVAHTQIKVMDKELKTLQDCKDAKTILELRVNELVQKTRSLEESLASTAAELAALGTTQIASDEAKRLAEQEVNVERKAVQAGEEARREVEVRMAVLQERFDAQAITLRLTKDQCVDLQERLLASEAAAKGKSGEVEVLTLDKLGRMEELKQMEVRFAKLQEQLGVQAACLGQATQRSEDLQEQLRASEVGCKTKSAAVERLSEEGLKRADELRQMDVRLTKLHEQVKSQAAAIKDGERRYQDLQKRQQASEAAFVKKAEEAKVLGAEGLKRIDDLGCAEVRSAKLQEQVDAQAAILETKEQCCEDLKEVQKNLEAELAAAQSTLEATRQDLHTERAALVAASLDFAVKLASYEETKRLLEEQVLEGLTRLVSRLDGQQASERERQVYEESRRTMEALVIEAKKLRGENLALAEKVARQGGLKARYEAGELVDDEKVFVEWLINLSSELHEQEDVVKDNELRRRENMNVKMQSKIRELESALARMLKQKQKDAGVPSKSMIDLNAWMTSSPIGPDPKPPTPVVAAGSPDVVMATVAVTTSPLPETKTVHVSSTSAAPALPQAPAPAPVLKAKAVMVTSKTPQPPPPVLTFEALNSFSSLDESDSEEDIPLSEISATMHTFEPASVLGKRERAASPARVIAKMEPKKTGNVNGRRLRGTRPPDSQLQEGVLVIEQKKAVDTNAKAKRKRK